MLTYDPLSSLAYPMITHALLVAGNLPIKTLVAGQRPTNMYADICTQCHAHVYTHTHTCTHSHIHNKYTYINFIMMYAHTHTHRNTTSDCRYHYLPVHSELPVVLEAYSFQTRQ